MKCLFTSNIPSIFQISESMLPLKLTIVNQGAPRNLVSFVNWALKGIKDRIIPLTPINPWKIVCSSVFAIT